jgi:hypothetical protein
VDARYPAKPTVISEGKGMQAASATVSRMSARYPHDDRKCSTGPHFYTIFPIPIYAYRVDR